MTIHGNTICIPTHRGTLQGDTISSFLFTIFMESLLRWISVGSRDCHPSYCTNPTITRQPSSHTTFMDTRTALASLRALSEKKNPAQKSPPLHHIHMTPARNQGTLSHWSPLGPRQPPKKKKTNSHYKNKSTPLHYRTVPTSNTYLSTNPTKCLSSTSTHCSALENSTHISQRMSKSWQQHLPPKSSAQNKKPWYLINS